MKCTKRKIGFTKKTLKILNFEKLESMDASRSVLELSSLSPAHLPTTNPTIHFE